jgi:hypothetical protein
LQTYAPHRPSIRRGRRGRRKGKVQFYGASLSQGPRPQSSGFKRTLSHGTKLRYTPQQTTCYCCLEVSDHNTQYTKSFDWLCLHKNMQTWTGIPAHPFSAHYSCKWSKITYIVVTQYLSVLRPAMSQYRVPPQHLAAPRCT